MIFAIIVKKLTQNCEFGEENNRFQKDDNGISTSNMKLQLFTINTRLKIMTSENIFHADRDPVCPLENKEESGIHVTYWVTCFSRFSSKLSQHHLQSL